MASLHPRHGAVFQLSLAIGAVGFAATLGCGASPEEPATVTTSARPSALVDGLHATFASETRPGLLSAFGLATRVPFVGAGRVHALRFYGDWVEPVLASGEAEPQLHASLPAFSDGWTELSEPRSGLSVRHRLAVAVGRERASLGNGVVVYERGAPGGGDALVRVTPTAVEDYLVLESAPTDAGVTYGAKKTKAIHDAKRFASATEVDITSRSTIFSFR